MGADSRRTLPTEIDRTYISGIERGVRNLSLDMIGLPPTLSELAAFENAVNASGFDTAYAAEVERLLKSPHFGERWGRIWLDVARYADSDGYEKDKPRSVWMYRDWVINAFNSDMPFDEFIVEQIAGDMLEAPSQEQQVATGFLRNSMVNSEGGIDPEQFRMEAMFDRMDAIGKAVLGLTVQCAQCHTHKYDPLQHTDYYRMFAFLNNCDEAEIAVYTPEEKEEWDATFQLIQQIEDRLRQESPDWADRMAAWEDTVRDIGPEWTVVPMTTDDISGQKYSYQDDGSVLAVGSALARLAPEFSAEVNQPRITGVRLEVLNDPSLPRGGPGRSVYGSFALTEFIVEVQPLGSPGEATNVKIASATADINPVERELDILFDDRSGRRFVTGRIELANDGMDETAWGIDVSGGRSNVPRKAVFAFDEPVDARNGVRLTFKLSQLHGGGIGDSFNNNLGRFRFSITAADKPTADLLPSDIRSILQIPRPNRTLEQTNRVFSYWRTTVPEWKETNARIESLWQSHPWGTSQLVLKERAERRKTHRLDRGSFLAPAEEVSPGVPDFLHTLSAADSANSSPNRLAFAKWLASRQSPTTARTIVNRIWQAYFGTGLVATTEDLGTQGEPPSHPELLDWLAVELMENNWSLKHIHRLIVASNAYQQLSAVTPELLDLDPANRLLARGPRFRVDAEVVRDIALTSSGLLYDKVGGPSVYPPAPAFLFCPPVSYEPKVWTTETGPNRYRRAIYAFRFRSVPFPMLQTFDAPSGEVSCARRSRSNTPLQALTLLNEPAFLGFSRSLALNTLRNGGDSTTDRLIYAVRTCLSRNPDASELDALSKFLDRQMVRFRRPESDPWSLLIDDTTSKSALAAEIPKGADPSDLAAWTALARVVLTLDEAITKE